MSSFYSRPNEKFPPGIKALIVINVSIWVLQLYFDKYANLGPYWLTNKIGLWPIGTEQFEPWQIITHMFAHASYSGMFASQIVFYHILFNMFALWMFGRILENLWGTKRFIIFYLICGLGAAALHLIMGQVLHAPADVAVGASGAVFGALVAFALTFPNTELYLMFIPIPIKAKWAVLGLVVLDFTLGFYNASGDSVAHFAHLGGAITGYLLLKYQNRNRKTFY